MSRLPVGFFVLPAEGERSVEAMKKKLALVALHALLTARPTQAGSLAGPFARLQGWLEDVARGPDKRALAPAFTRVDVLAPILAFKSGLAPLEEVLPSLVPALLVELGRHVEGSHAMLWDVPVARVVDAGRGRVLVFEPPARGLLLDGSGLELRTATGERVELPLDSDPASLRVEHPFAPLGPGRGPVLAEVDTNPLAMLEEHPEKGGNASSLGEHGLDEWTQALGEAMGVIEAALPALHAELVATLERMVPVGYEAERHFSASYREAPGLIYLTLHPSPLTLAEAIVHETQHGKLNILRWFDPLLENADSTWCRSAVRPDLRPLSGVFLAVHAFVPVAALHLALAELGHPLAATGPFEQRRADVLAANAHGLATLRELGRPTPLGQRVLDGLEELHRHVSAAATHSASTATVTALG